jgi:hypothetical protein
MQLNRNTIALLVISLAVIIGVLLVNSNQANAPSATTPTAAEQTGGPIFAGVTANTLVRFEIRDNTTGARTVLTRSSEDVWGLDEANEGNAFPADDASGVLVETTAEPGESSVVSPQDTFGVETTTGQQLDQNVVLSDIGAFLSIEASDSFESDELESFGLVNPGHSLIATAEDGTIYVLHVGGQNPSGNRYYAVLEQLAGADVSEGGASVTEEPLAVATIALAPGDDQAQSSDNIQGAELEEAVSGTDEAALEVVEDVTEAAEISQMLDATNIAAGTQIATQEAEGDATAEAGSEDSEAVATQLVEEGESSGRTEQVTSGDELSEATAEAGDETTGALEMTPEVTAPAAPQPTATLAPLAEPLVVLEGSQTIYTLPKSAVDALIAFLTAPPVATPTMEPTVQVPLPEVTVESTIDPEAIPDSVEATEEPAS